MDDATTPSVMLTESFLIDNNHEEKKHHKRTLDQAFKQNRQKIILKKRLNISKTSIETDDSRIGFSQTLDNANLYTKENYTTFTPSSPIRHKIHTLHENFVKFSSFLSFTPFSLLKSELKHEGFLSATALTHPILPHNFDFASVDTTMLNVNEEYLEFRSPIQESLTSSTSAFIRRKPENFMSFTKECSQGYNSFTEIKHKFPNIVQPSDDMDEASPPTKKILSSLNLMCGIREIWYQKYQPKTFLDLISEESFNRQFLSMLSKIKKSQGRAKVDVTKPAPVENTKYKKNAQLLKTFEIMKPKSEPAMKNIGAIAAARQSSVDMSSILLIAGPFGSGKTSAARILARQAGYNVIEITASEYKSKERLISMVKNVVGLDSSTMACFFGNASTNTKTHRDNLLIIDEIEEADSNAIDALLKLSLDRDKTDLVSILKRPVICICTHLYHRVLRDFRKHVKVLKVDMFSPTKIIKRLNYICNSENLNVDGEAIHQLVAYCHGDMRLALNTLECFAGLPLNSCVTVHDIKEIWTTYYADRMFQDVEILNSAFTSLNESKSGSSYYALMDFLSNRSLDTNILQTLLLENIHNIPFSDVLFLKMSCLTDIICQVDCIVYSSGNTNTTSALSLLFTHLFCRIPKYNSAADQRRLLAALQPYAFTLSYRSDIIFKKKKLIRNSFINNSVACLRSRLISFQFTKEILFFLILLITPSYIFNENEFGWRQYHKLSIRPSAGIPLEGILSDPLNRFHHFLEILLCYSLTFSKSISHEFAIPPLLFTQNNADTVKSIGVLPNQFNNIFYFDPPLHMFFENHARSFLATVKPGCKSITVSKIGSTNLHTCPNSSQTFYNFLEVNTLFTGYDYINLQLTRAHSDLLRKELTFLGETGVLPQAVPKLSANVTKNITQTTHAHCTPKQSIAIIPFETILIDIQQRQERRSKHETTSWRFHLPQPLVLPQELIKKQYCELFDADFRCNKCFFYTYDHGDAKAVQYYPTFKDLTNPESI